AFQQEDVRRFLAGAECVRANERPIRCLQSLAQGRNRMDNLGTNETLVRRVETRSFSAAARDLKIGQPAVSKSVAQLEERICVQLLLRSARCLTATETSQ